MIVRKTFTIGFSIFDLLYQGRPWLVTVFLNMLKL